MKCFEILLIETTTDQNIIKKQYAKLSKEFSPYDFPNEFLIIKAAYDEAMEYARKKDVNYTSFREGFARINELIIEKKETILVENSDIFEELIFINTENSNEFNEALKQLPTPDFRNIKMVTQEIKADCEKEWTDFLHSDLFNNNIMKPEHFNQFLEFIHEIFAADPKLTKYIINIILKNDKYLNNEFKKVMYPKLKLLEQLTFSRKSKIFVALIIGIVILSKAIIFFIRI